MKEFFRKNRLRRGAMYLPRTAEKEIVQLSENFKPLVV